MANSPNPIDITSTEHYLWGDGCDGWHLLKQPDLSVIQECVPPGKAETKHFHSNARQFFYVLSGSATIEFDDHNQTFGPGQGIHIPPNVPHRFVNRGSDNVIFLVISSPSTMGDRTNLSSST